MEYDLSGRDLVATADLPIGRFHRYGLPLPGDTPLGYHRVEAELTSQAGGSSAETRLIVCPARAFLPAFLKQGGWGAGLAVSLYGLRSARNWGCGDFTDLRRLTDWCVVEAPVSFIALNPLHAIANRQPFNTSPYLPSSSFFRNSLYLDVERIPGFAECPSAQALLASGPVQAEIEALRASQFVEYERVHTLKMAFLKLLFRDFLAGCRRRPERGREFRAYVEREGELLDRYATYCALEEWLHRRHPSMWIWPHWPVQYQDPDSEATRAFARSHALRVDFYKYVQWQVDRQLGQAHAYARKRGLSIGLYHDLALATDRCGADLWAHREFYVSGCRVGAPPDDFAPKGQDWGFPPPNAWRHRRDGYRLFAESIRRNCRHGGALRLDHVMRLFHLYWIPEGLDATRGVYVRDHARDLLGVLALESVRAKAIIVGEDLGTVADEIREELERFGVLSYRLLYFERRRDGTFKQPEEYPRQALVSATTHDLATLAGFWIGRDIEARRAARLPGSEDGYWPQWEARRRDKQALLDALGRRNLLPPWFPRLAADVPELTGELHNAVIGYLAGCPSMLMVLNQEDLTKETEQQNLPGSTYQYPNWRRKMKFSLEELFDSNTARDFARMFRNWLDRSGRRNRPS